MFEPGQPELWGILGERPLVDCQEARLVGFAEERRAEARLQPVDPLLQRARQLLGQFLADLGRGCRKPGSDEIPSDRFGLLLVGDHVRGRRWRSSHGRGLRSRRGGRSRRDRLVDAGGV